MQCRHSIDIITSWMLRIVGERECSRKIRSTYNITVCTVRDRYIYIYICRKSAVEFTKRACCARQWRKVEVWMILISTYCKAWATAKHWTMQKVQRAPTVSTWGCCMVPFSTSNTFGSCALNINWPVQRNPLATSPVITSVKSFEM